jgi:hypothetical protein
MKKFVLRDLETVKTTAALYGCSVCPWNCPAQPPIIITA